MSVYRKKGEKIWYCNFWVNKKHYQFSCKTQNKALARQVETALKEKIRLKEAYGIDVSFSAPTFDEAVEDYLAGTEIAETSLVRYEAAFKPLLRHFGGQKVSTIAPIDVERYKSARLKDCSPATVKFEIGALKAVFKRLVDTDVLVKSPIATVKPPKVNNIQDRILNDKEMKKYLSVAKQPLKDFAILMTQTGARPVELLNLKPTDVEDDKIIIRKSKTASGRRVVPLTDKARKVLTNRPNVFKKANYLTLNRLHKQAIEDAGIEPAKLYSFRHRFATELIAAGVNDATVAKLMGHADLSMLRRYVHLAEDHLHDAIKRID